MKRKGFTLAEVLITLAIIGVVAALAAPILQGAFQRAKVGPSLRKFKSTIEVANESMMGDLDTNILSQAITTPDIYYDKIKGYVQGNISGTTSSANPTISNYYGSEFSIENVDTYVLASKAAFAIIMHHDEEGTTTTPNGSFKGYFADLYYDMNGFNTKPNRLGKDIFVFKLDDSGFVIPYGGKQDAAAYSVSEENSADICSSTELTTGLSCAGSVADNNWRVVYDKIKKKAETP